MADYEYASEEYDRLLRLGKKENTPMPILDEILESKQEKIVGEIPLGLVQIPMFLIEGTKTESRSNAFSKSFYPLLAAESEFGIKWKKLYCSHLEEGIREPIIAYEYMNKFYVQEGNKRVSVLKSVGAVSVPGYVTRLVPRRTNEPENVIYYEFMEFYALSGINYVWFSKPGGFERLQKLVGKRPDEKWTELDKEDFSSVYTNFSQEYEAKRKKGMPATSGDAFLCFIALFDYKSLFDMSSTELKEKIEQTWQEFFLLTPDEALEVQMDPVLEDKKTVSKIITGLLASGVKEKVAFIQPKTTETSGWTYGHELGRLYVDELFKDEIETKSYFNATEENGDELFKQAVEDGNTIIFATAPTLLKPSLRAAIEYPNVKILNCSLNTSHKLIRTYYARMYEAKFLMGAIAGAMAHNDKIGYVADYPIFGMTANINAFAMGAKMVNPRATIYLEWSSMKDCNYKESFAAKEIEVISAMDFVPVDAREKHFGLYRTTDQSYSNLAMPVWHWGKFYEKMIQNILNGTWKFDEASAQKGLNYWWGMSADVIEVFCSHTLPIGTARLVELLKKTIESGDFNPFSGVLYSQNGMVQKDPDKLLSPEEIIRMDWLADNVVGHIPTIDEIAGPARSFVEISGIANVGVDTTVV